MLGAYVPITMLLPYPSASGGRNENTAANVIGCQEWYSRSPSSQAHLIFRITGLGTRVSSSLPFPVARDQSYPDYILVLSQLSGSPWEWEIRH